MRPRKYTTVIEVWNSKQVPDPIGGGTTPEEVFKFSKWAQIRTQGAGRKFQDYGLNEFKNPVIFRIRKGTNEIEEGFFIKYQENKFIVKGIENVNLIDREINIYCDEA